MRVDRGPDCISRENVQRKIVVQANVAGRDLRGAVGEIRGRLDANLDLPRGYFVEFGGQFGSEERSTRTVTLLSIISIASLVGFVTLFGIAVRNGILMVSHHDHLIDEEGLPVGEAVVQGSLERLSPILVTAPTTGLALIPLALFSRWGRMTGSE